jgi:Domain of unknown function (DUF4145)
MPKKSVPPSIEEVAFDCPHCGAYTTQTWFDLQATAKSGESRVPDRTDPDILEVIRADKNIPEERKQSFVDYFEKKLTGRVFLENNERGKYVYSDVHNLNISTCFSCGEFAVWVSDRLVYPSAYEGPEPNADLPEDVRRDYEEASRILVLSPRGSAALLRLAIQRLCIALGEKGKNLDDDIASLVRKGLTPLIQKALDTVRVIGNESVHPGVLDMKDDVDTAMKLFALVNIIAEQMISNPKHVDALYGKIPDQKRRAIEERDKKT